jgi:hypothetical protein
MTESRSEYLHADLIWALSRAIVPLGEADLCHLLPMHSIRAILMALLALMAESQVKRTDAGGWELNRSHATPLRHDGRRR